MEVLLSVPPVTLLATTNAVDESDSSSGDNKDDAKSDFIGLMSLYNLELQEEDDDEEVATTSNEGTATVTTTIVQHPPPTNITVVHNITLDGPHVGYTLSSEYAYWAGLNAFDSLEDAVAAAIEVNNIANSSSNTSSDSTVVSARCRGITQEGAREFTLHVGNEMVPTTSTGNSGRTSWLLPREEENNNNNNNNNSNIIANNIPIDNNAVRESVVVPPNVFIVDNRNINNNSSNRVVGDILTIANVNDEIEEADSESESSDGSYSDTSDSSDSSDSADSSSYLYDEDDDDDEEEEEDTMVMGRYNRSNSDPNINNDNTNNSSTSNNNNGTIASAASTTSSSSTSLPAMITCSHCRHALSLVPPNIWSKYIYMRNNIYFIRFI